jgi:hypothetical protein
VVLGEVEAGEPGFIGHLDQIRRSFSSCGVDVPGMSSM